MEIRLAQSEEDLEKVAWLNAQNLGPNLTTEEKDSQGFVSIHYPVSFLKRMVGRIPQIIAVDKDEVVGYCLLLDRVSASEVKLKVPLYSEMDILEYEGKKLKDWQYLIVGQICVAKAYRGKRLSERLYGFCKQTFRNTFPLLLTTVSNSNPRSLIAHKRVGFEIMPAQPSKQWNVVLWDLQIK